MALGLLVLSGFALFLSTWRRVVGPFFAVVQWTHILGGIFYGIAIIGWSRFFYPWAPGTTSRHLGPGYARWAYFILLVLLLSGLGLLVGPSSTRAAATVLHGLSALALVVWALWHLLTRLPIWKKPSGQWHLSRRRALRWTAAAVVAVPVVMGLPTLMKMLSGRLFAEGSNDGALPGFVPYTVINGFPDIPRDRWHLWVHGVPDAKTLDWAEYASLPRRQVVINFHCVTGWVVPHVEFEGVDLLQFLTRLGWDPVKKPWVTFYSGDGVYTDTLDIGQIRQYRPLLTDVIDHQPLPVAQGFPVRLLVPNMYGYKSVKWLVGIRVSERAELGFWEQRGYPQNAYFGSYP
jgi:DMSO/TMAO reductase YedYZ molybdopterin-dependent catalytic subunit